MKIGGFIILIYVVILFWIYFIWIGIFFIMIIGKRYLKKFVLDNFFVKMYVYLNMNYM